ncbi:MAG: hypothetical protein PHX61_07165 [Alphaproteobacteria bacterium]|nr:hypothetical protein [Alphaproteobacteria bacterium]
MMLDDPYKELRSTLSELRKNKVETRVGIVPESVALLLEKLELSTTAEDRNNLYFYLDAELMRWGDIPLRVQFLQKFCQESPSDPLRHATLSHALAALFLEKNENTNFKKEALDLGFKSLDSSVEENRFIRYCGSSLARLAISLDEYDALNHALKYLVSPEAANCQEDIPHFECEYINDIDVSRCDKELFYRYKVICGMV